MEKIDIEVTTDVLIIGTGPAGASLACFLASYGIKGLIVNRASTNADTPRAHITNMAAMECFRDIGIEQDLMKLATKGDTMIHGRWSYSMAGREYARVYSWGNDPKRKGDYEQASPCTHVDLPQTLLEPALVRNATLHGFQARFDTEFVAFNDHGDFVVTTLRDRITNIQFNVRSRYLFGADGARSKVAHQLQLQFAEKPRQGFAINVMVEADLDHLMAHRKGNLHWLIQPDKEHPKWGQLCIARMVKPWHEWIFIFFPTADADSGEVHPERDYLKRVKELIGDDTPAKILGVSKWFINETVAEAYSKGNVFCLGDSCHRHPPVNGLGSNTCVQDAFNLAWKVAYVMQGKAGDSLLDSYSAERQPVGQGIVKKANDGLRESIEVWNAFGLTEASVSQRSAALDELQSDTPAGRERRKRLQQAIEHTGTHEFHALGIEMGQKYESSAIYGDGTVESDADVSIPSPTTQYVPSTVPGRRLPHVWLRKAIPNGLISTIDLAGKGTFCLFTGIGGEKWRDAAAKVFSDVGVTVKVFSIGWGQEYEDAYFDWARVRGVEESGCVLARPDMFVAWRASEMLGTDGWAEKKLLGAIKAILAM